MVHINQMIDPSVITSHPLFGLTLTLTIYFLAVFVYDRLGRPPFIHPVLIAVTAISVLLATTGISYEQYFSQALPLHNMLGVFVVLLSVPLVRQLYRLNAAKVAVGIALVIGSVVAVSSALMPGFWLDVDYTVAASIAPKSATAAVAVGISERLDGLAGVAAMTAVLTGICGAVIGPGLLATAGVHDERAMGFSMGVASHAIGTARAFQISEVAGAFASLGMILNALLTVALAPFAISLLYE